MEVSATELLTGRKDMGEQEQDPSEYVRNIRQSGLTIYDPIAIGDVRLWIPTPELESLLDKGLRGMSLEGLALRTRAKEVRRRVCKVLGYPSPASFTRTQPRFPGQSFDVYVQKSNNLQIWNEQLSSTRRYVLVRVSGDDVVTRVKVVTGDTLSLLDPMGTLTQKYQARCIPGDKEAELVVQNDTALLRPFLSESVDLRSVATPVRHPRSGQLLPISTVFERLRPLVGKSFDDAGHDQERNRGATLHRLVCRSLGYATYQDDGQFPDVHHQLLEVKLQTSPTIDLGLVRPNSAEPLDVPQIEGKQIRHCDVRYAVFCGITDGETVTLTHLILANGVSFFKRFEPFEGQVLNEKLQIHLPADLFDR